MIKSELVPSDSQRTLFTKITLNPYGRKLHPCSDLKKGVDPLRRQKNENEHFLISCGAFSVFDHCFKVKCFVFDREPEGKRGREFPSVKTEKIKSRFVIFY